MSRKRLFHEHIDALAQARPHDSAVICGYETLQYGELVQRANHLAHRLRALGVGPETLVGLCVERSVHMVVAILGILKAGGAYVPLDPAYPQERLEYMIKDSATPVIVAQQSTRSVVEGQSSTVLYLDDGNVDHFSARAPESNISLNNLAYVIYTSGSTGKPKGVMSEHRGLCALSDWVQASFTKEDTHRVLCASSLSFDVSVMEIVAALSTGGACVIVKNILDLILAEMNEPISLIFGVPSSLTEVIHAGAIPSSTRVLLTGGEILPASLVHQAYEKTNIRTFMNAWGVTEDSVLTTVYTVPRTIQNNPPIGQAIAQRYLYLVDENLQPVPDGTPGEICCGGLGVARGYLNRLELTEERFVTNPFGDSPTMYRSGDLAIRKEDGEVYFIGRNDQQIKIRGFRVELGEIETVVNDYPGILCAAVVAPIIHGVPALSLYIVGKSQAEIVIPELRDFLAQRLPAHMVPADITGLDSIPIGPTGKIDRAALRALGRQRPDLPQSYAAPNDSYEIELETLFSSLLQMSKVGIHDSFFALGGQSLLAARCMADIYEAFPKEVAHLDERLGSRALQKIFAMQPTIAAIAAVLRGEHQEIEQSTHPGFKCLQQGDPMRTPLFLFHGVIRGEAYYVWNIAHGLGAQQPIYTLAPHGSEGEPVPETIEEMASDYLRCIIAVQPQGPYHFAGYCNGGLVAFEVAQMLEALGHRVANLTMIASPLENMRFAGVKRALEAFSWVPGFHKGLRQKLFLTIRGRLLAFAASDYFAAKVQSLFSMRATSSSNETSITQLFDTRTAIEKRDDERYMHIIKAYEAYVPHKRYGGSIRVIWGEEDAYYLHQNPERDWSLAAASVRQVVYPGNHHFLEQDPNQILQHLFEMPEEIAD